MSILSAKTFRKYISNVLIFILICSIISVCKFGESKAVSLNQYPTNFGDKNAQAVSFMINVYEGEEYVYKMLDILDRYGFKGTFFVGGSYIANKESMLKEILTRGHELGNHGTTHKDLNDALEDVQIAEIKNCHNIVLALTGYKMSIFTPSSGSFDEKTVKAAESLGYKTVLWTYDTIDWRDKNVNLIVNRATKDLKSGNIILMHPKAQTVEALPQICEIIKSKELTAITVSEILGNYGKINNV